MLTSTANLIAFTNISLICRKGSEAVGRISKASPFSTTKNSTEGCCPSPLEERVILRLRKDSDFSVAAVVSAALDVASEAEQDEQDQQSDGATAESTLRNKNTKRLRSVVRFAKQTTDHPELSTNSTHENCQNKRNSRPLKRKKFESSDSVLWWTKEELKDIQQAFFFAVKSCESGLPLVPGASIEDNNLSSLDRYSSRNRKRRKLVRYQMYETVLAVEEFEIATKTKAPPEMLSQLLQRYSAPSVLEATKRAMRIVESFAVLNTSRNVAKTCSLSLLRLVIITLREYPRSL